VLSGEATHTNCIVFEANLFSQWYCLLGIKQQSLTLFHLIRSLYIQMLNVFTSCDIINQSTQESVRLRVIVRNTSFNNISAKSRLSILLVEKTGVTCRKSRSPIVSLCCWGVVVFVIVISIYSYLCNQCASLQTLLVWIPLRRGVLDTTLCDHVYQWLTTGHSGFLQQTVSTLFKHKRLNVDIGALLL
jgi:hypothetical protein